jgi:transcription initiation factor TFIID TATA-box-binding protein
MDETVQGNRISEVEIVNIVASGKFDVKLDLENVAEDLPNAKGIKSAEHSRRSGNRLLVHFANQDTLSILAPSGVYMFTGVDSYKELEYAKSGLLSALAELGIISSPNPASKEIIDPFQVQNIVCTAELKGQEGVNLNQLAISLGLEKTEYEPEQFPGLVYRPNSSSCTILVFSSGKMVITGIDDEKTADLELEGLQQELYLP